MYDVNVECPRRGRRQGCRSGPLLHTCPCFRFPTGPTDEDGDNWAKIPNWGNQLCGEQLRRVPEPDGGMGTEER